MIKRSFFGVAKPVLKYYLQTDSVQDLPVPQKVTLLLKTSSNGGAAGTLATAGTVIMANLALAGSPKPSKAALDIFDEIYEKGTLLSIIGGLATYENMVMEKFSAPRNAATGGALVFKASFRQITIASGQSVEIPKEAKSEAIKDLSATERHQGVKQGTVLEETKASRPASWAYRLIWGSN